MSDCKHSLGGTSVLTLTANVHAPAFCIFCERDRLIARVAELEAERSRLAVPEIANFLAGVESEAKHQRSRWASDHDAGKAPEDWFWLLGYLAGKALASVRAGNGEKARHHCISSAAALYNWHAAISGESTAMRPGIEPPSAALGSES